MPLPSRGLLVLATLAGCAGFAPAQQHETVPVPNAPAPAQVKPLEIGDPAPALDIGAWVKGDSVKSFEKGKAYVVEFWATWCMPCKASIPKLTSLQEKFPDKKLTVIGVSIDQGGLNVVRPFVEKMGAKMDYTVALDAGGTVAAYMAATGRSGIPYSYVIDTNGKLAWHGHPSDALELVAGEVAAGKFDPKKHQERQNKFHELDGKFSQAKNDKKWDEAAALLDEIAQLRPDLAGNLLITRYWIKSGGQGDSAGAVAYAKKLADNELKNDPENLLLLADQVCGTKDLKPEDRQWATSLARKVVDVTKGRNPSAFAILSYSLEQEGKFDEAMAGAQKCIDATEDPMEKRYYSGRLDELKKKADAEKAKADAPKTDTPATSAKP